MKNGWRFILLPAIILFCGIGPVAAQTVDGMQIAPVDTAEARRLRIWAAAEQTSKCRMAIEILNDSQVVVRHFIEFLASKGYYNFYWDKRDDSGRLVPEGAYRARIGYCGTTDWETLEVRYSQAERESELLPGDSSNPYVFGIRLEGAARVVRAELLDARGRSVDVMAADTTLEAGVHRFLYRPKRPPKRGNYVMRIQVGDAEYRREVSFLP